MTKSTTTVVSKVPFWHNVTFRSWAFQLIVLIAVVSFFAYLADNFSTNTANIDIPLGFDFLDTRAGFNITGSDFDNNSTMRNAFWYGFLNTVRLVMPGLVLTTVLGILIGVGKLSKNYMVRTLATVYVEAVRNIPLLVFIFLISNVVINTTFPRFNSVESDKVFTGWEWFGGNVIVTRRGLDFPWFVGSASTLLAAFLCSVVLWWLLARWRRRVNEATGVPARSGLWGFGAVSLLMVATWVVFDFSVTTPAIVPDVSSGAVVKATGGLYAPSGYLAMLAALVIYTSSHIAEIVRGSILAVPKGQGEAAYALAFSGFQRMWYVVLPQALRTAIPPLGNQYLNLMKNSSLAGVVAYFDLFAVARTGVGNQQPAIPTFMVALVVYLSFSLTISVLVNIYNKRMAYVTK